MKLFRNRVFLGILCILAGLLAGFVVLPALTNSVAETRPVLVLKTAAPYGTQITADMVTTQNLPESVFNGALEKAGDAVGKYAAADLFAGDVLTAAKLSTDLQATDALAAAAEKGKRVVSVTLPNLAAGISGRLRPGDIVSIMATPKNGGQSLGLDPDAETAETTTSATALVKGLEALEVCMVTTADAADAHVSANPGKDEKNALPVTVSFYVTPEQAVALAALEQDSTIHLAFVSRGSADGVQLGTEGD